MNNINDNQLNHYIQLSNAIFTFDKMENSAHAFGKHFSNAIGYKPDMGCTITDTFELTLDTQNFEMEARRAKETIKAIKLISTEAATDLKTRYQSIVEELNSNVCEKGLKETQIREELVQKKLGLIKNNGRSTSTADQLEVQMLMNDLSNISDASLNAFNSISKHRKVSNTNKAIHKDPYEQLSEAILTLDRTENSAYGLDKFFTHVTEYKAETCSNITDMLALTLANQNFELEATQARKAIKAIKLISPESAAELTTRYQSILQGLYTKINETGLYELQFREVLAKDKLALMKNQINDVSIVDSFETQMLMNDLANISTITSNLANLIQKQRI